MGGGVYKEFREKRADYAWHKYKGYGSVSDFSATLGTL